jgi:serine beta-lactamase-like protein LACTB, mitochondrial
MRVPPTAAILLLMLSTAAVASEPFADAQRRGIGVAIRSFMTEREAPSVSLAIMKDGKLAFSQAWGLSDLENFVPAEEETIYRIASVAKPMTAAAVLQLAQEGKIDLFAPVQGYVSAFPQRYGAVTIRDLLRHTSGVRHYKPGEFGTTRRCGELAEALEIFGADAMEHAPGERITYSSHGYVLLGLALENVIGKSFPDLMEERIFAPAGMVATRTDDPQVIIPNRARGYAKAADGGVRNADLVDTTCRIPAGGLVATAGDVARFGGALLEGRLLENDWLVMMTSSQLPPETVARTLEFLGAPPGYEPPGFGFGWALGTEKNGKAVWHGGNQQGATSVLYLVPDEQLVIAILSNLGGQGDAMVALADEIAVITQQ